MPRLVIIAGPTAAGKTALAVQLAQQWQTEILSCDSRQFYSEMRIGVARPTADELHAATHHFVACRHVWQPYNIYDYSADAMRLLDNLFRSHDTVIACGGSGLYIDALISEPARLPDPSPTLRHELQQMPLDAKRARLRELDPAYYARVDLNNPVRLQRALEVCLTASRPYSELISEQQSRPRPFDIEVRLVSPDPSTLRQRIDARVDAMMAEGLADEVRSLIPYRHLNTLRTVGYRELFEAIDGRCTTAEAVANIKLHTWQYARKQNTWMRKYQSAASTTA